MEIGFGPPIRVLRRVAALAAAFAIAAAPLYADTPKDPSPRDGSTRAFWFTRSNLLVHGEHALAQGKAARAVRLSERALDKVLERRDREVALTILCIAYTRLAEYADALERCEELVEKYPPSWRNLNNRANALLLSGRIDEAIADYRKAMAMLGDDEQRVDTFAAGSNRFLDVSEVLEHNLVLARLRREVQLEAQASDPAPPGL